MAAQLVRASRGRLSIMNSGCCGLWPGNPLCCAPLATKIALLASTAPVLVRIKNPPQGCARVTGVKTTGCYSVPLITTWPSLVMFTPELSRTMVPSPIVSVEPAGRATWPPTEMRELAGQSMAPLRFPETLVHVVLDSILIVLLVETPGMLAG